MSQLILARAPVLAIHYLSLYTNRKRQQALLAIIARAKANVPKGIKPF